MTFSWGQNNDQTDWSIWKVSKRYSSSTHFRWVFLGPHIFGSTYFLRLFTIFFQLPGVHWSNSKAHYPQGEQGQGLHFAHDNNTPAVSTLKQLASEPILRRIRLLCMTSSVKMPETKFMWYILISPSGVIVCISFLYEASFLYSHSLLFIGSTVVYIHPPFPSQSHTQKPESQKPNWLTSLHAFMAELRAISDVSMRQWCPWLNKSQALRQWPSRAKGPEIRFWAILEEGNQIGETKTSWKWFPWCNDSMWTCLDCEKMVSCQ